MSWRYRASNGTDILGTVDNSWVVSYCLMLSSLFQSHLNIYLCISRIGGIRYLFKYLCRETDKVTLQMVGGQHPYDKISTFEKEHFVSASEVVWILFQFDIVVRYPSVIGLDIHVESHHTDYFREYNKRNTLRRVMPATKNDRMVYRKPKMVQSSSNKVHKLSLLLHLQCAQNIMDCKSETEI